MKTGCVEWAGARDGDGYGSVLHEGRLVGAHRVACAKAHGAAPKDKPWALHTCDNPPCTKGSHLYWGSPTENARDRVRRGRDFNGSKTHCKNDHEFTPENTMGRGARAGRQCKACHRNRARAAYQTRSAR